MIDRLRNFWSTLNPPDQLTAVFSALMALLILSRLTVLGTATAFEYAGNYAAVLVFALVVVPIIDMTKHKTRWVGNPLVLFVRYLYPAILLGIFFNWTQPVSHMFFSEPIDPLLVRIDYFLFGFNPGKELVGMLGNNYWLSEYMNFAYLSYYATPWLALYFYFAKQKEKFYYTAFVACLVIYTCFFFQTIIPAEGPIYNDPSIHGHIVAGPISAAASAFLSGADVPGSAMPSGHVAGTMVIFLLTWQLFRKAFWFTAPLWLSLVISTVYGHFHYLIDGVAGLALAVVYVFWLGPLLYARLFPQWWPEGLPFPGEKQAEEHAAERSYPTKG